MSFTYLEINQIFKSHNWISRNVLLSILRLLWHKTRVSILNYMRRLTSSTQLYYLAVDELIKLSRERKRYCMLPSAPRKMNQCIQKDRESDRNSYEFSRGFNAFKFLEYQLKRNSQCSVCFAVDTIRCNAGIKLFNCSTAHPIHSFIHLISIKFLWLSSCSDGV